VVKFPLKFTVQSESVSGIQSSWLTKADSFEHRVPVAIPPEFEGPDPGLSSEDIYAMALQNCFIATFKVFAEKSQLNYNSIRVKSILEVDRDEMGRPWMARLNLHVFLNGAIQLENAQRILEKTSKNCMILNSVNNVKTFQFDLLH